LVAERRRAAAEAVAEKVASAPSAAKAFADSMAFTEALEALRHPKREFFSKR
jgi:hypothetical protein